MKLVFQITAAIIIAGLFFWVCGMALTAGAIHGFADSLPGTTATAPPKPDAHQAAQAQYDRWNAETDREAARERAQAARCVVRTADGRELHCDPAGPFTPR